MTTYFTPQQLTTQQQPAPRAIRNRNQKFDSNVTKRGHVPVGKAGEHVDDPPLSKGLIAFFVFVVVGSSIVQVLRMFQTSVPDFSDKWRRMGRGSLVIMWKHMAGCWGGAFGWDWNCIYWKWGYGSICRLTVGWFKLKIQRRLQLFSYSYVWSHEYLVQIDNRLADTSKDI